MRIYSKNLQKHMKIKQFSFNIDHKSSAQKTKKEVNQNAGSQIIHSNRSLGCSPNLKTSSIKRLKYYSTKNKQTIPQLDQNNIQIFEQEFRKFQDMNMKNNIKFTNYQKKDAINLIVKKYYRNYKSHYNKIQLKNQHSTNIYTISSSSNEEKLNKNKQQNIQAFSDRQCRSYNDKNIQRSLQKEVKKINQINNFVHQNLQSPKIQKLEIKDNILIQDNQQQNQPNSNNQLQQINTDQQIRQINPQITRYDQLKNQKHIQNKKPTQQMKPQKIKQTQISFNNTFNICFQRKNSSKRKVLIEQQRLKRHMFNKSSISKFQNYNKYGKSLEQINAQSHHSSALSHYSNNSLQKSCPVHQQTSKTIKKSQTSKSNKISKRYISIDNNAQSQTFNVQIPIINPYTNRQYLHIKNQIENLQIKTIQKIIKTSYKTNIVKSINVKSFSLEKDIKSNQKISQKEDGYRKHRYESRKQLYSHKKPYRFTKKNKTGYENDPNGIKGWQHENQSMLRDNQFLQVVI